MNLRGSGSIPRPESRRSLFLAACLGFGFYKGKRLGFVTNNSTKSRKQYGKKFETLDLSVSEEEIFASSFAAAAYLKSIDFNQSLGRNRKPLYRGGPEPKNKQLRLERDRQRTRKLDISPFNIGLKLSSLDIVMATICNSTMMSPCLKPLSGASTSGLIFKYRSVWAFVCSGLQSSGKKYATESSFAYKLQRDGHF